MNVRQMVSKVRGLTRAVQSQYMVAKLLARMEMVTARASVRKTRIDEETEAALKELRAKIEPRARMLFAFYDSQRGDLPASSTGTIAKTPAGECEWYPGADSIEVFDEKAAIAFLEQKGEEGAIRRKVELNKEHLLANKQLVAAIPGIRIAKEPKLILRTEGTKARIELSAEGVIGIVFPKKKK